MSDFSTVSRNEIVNLLRRYDISPTQQRIEIAEVLFEKPQHLSADEVLAKANINGASVSKATVYNTLGLLAQRGLIREVIVDPTRVFYDPTTTPHHHFYNVDDGTLIDIDATSITVGMLPAIPEGTIIQGVDVIIRLKNDAAAGQDH